MKRGSFNDLKVSFEDIPEDKATEIEIEVENVGTITLLALDTDKADKDTRRHGVSWQVRKKLVGAPDKRFIDGRRSAAKRFNFIAKADCLELLVEPDWSGFQEQTEQVKNSFKAVQSEIDLFLKQNSLEQRSANLESLRKKNLDKLRKLSYSEVELWTDFVEKVQDDCPTLSFSHLESVASILAKLEASKSKYTLLEQLQNCNSADLDALSGILQDWTLSTAKEVLDELKWRLEVIADLEDKMLSDATDELRDLQPIFDRGLWIFGPEFESIHFTSNRTMGTVIKELFGDSATEGSANRPDFLILPDSSMSIYSCGSFDEENGEEIGCAQVVIVELKKPSVRLGEAEKRQCMKYSKELQRKGVIQNSTKIRCFLLGKTIDPLEVNELNDGPFTVRPLTFEVVLNRAKARTLKLFDRVKKAPFLSELENGFLNAGLQGSVFALNLETSQAIDMSPTPSPGVTSD